MLTYILRRIVYSIPVLIIASFFVFWGIRTTYDPTAKLRTSKDAARRPMTSGPIHLPRRRRSGKTSACPSPT